MAGRKRSNPDLILLLEDLLKLAKDGEVTRLFTVIGYCDDFFTHDYATDDIDDLLLQVRTEVIRCTSDLARIDGQAPH